MDAAPEGTLAYKLGKLPRQAWTASATRWLLLVAATGCAIGWYAGWYPRATTWGDGFTALAGLATTAAVFVALYGIATERQDRKAAEARAESADKRAERAEARAEKADERAQKLYDEAAEARSRELASKVTWWIANVNLGNAEGDKAIARRIPLSSSGVMRDGEPNPTEIYLHIINASHSVAYDCKMYFNSPPDPEAEGASRHWYELGQLGPGEHVFKDHYSLGMSRGSGAFRPINRMLRNEVYDYLEFTDGAGKHWRRHRLAGLTSISERPGDMALSDY